jgi:hypothetical protein
VLSSGTARASDIVGRVSALIKRVAPRKDTLDINEIMLELVGLARAKRTGTVFHSRSNWPQVCLSFKEIKSNSNMSC